MSELTPAERKTLKGRAHALAPVVTLGSKGLTAAVYAEIDRALAAHELIKIAARGLERDERDAAMAEICARTGAQAVQHIGKVLVVYRKKPEEAAPGPGARPKRAASPARSERRGSRSASRRRESAPTRRRRSASR
jgi:putative YhbY family RNA-binding protein